MPKAEIPHMQHANPTVYATLWYPCVLDTPLTYLTILLGKASLDTRIGWLNPEFYEWVVKIWIQLFDSHLHQLLHGAICFVAFGNRIRSCTYGIMLVRLHVFHFLSYSHTAYMESRLKTTHHLFKWCRLLKAVFIAVYCSFEILFI